MARPARPRIRPPRGVGMPASSAAFEAAGSGKLQRRSVVDRHEQVDLRPLGGQQPSGIGDDLVEHLVGIVDGGDPGRDLAQRALGVGQPRVLLARAGQRIEPIGVRDGDGRVRREGFDERDVVGIERAPCGRHRPGGSRAARRPS